MKSKYSDSDFANPTAACDIIMKGGISSGVVYPLAIIELAKRYRFSNLGGTSAGAIAAAAAAAAEYGRHVPGKGFMRLTQLPDEVGKLLFRFFQPSPELKPLFNIFVAAIGTGGTVAKLKNMILAAVAGFFPLAVAASLPGVLIVLAACWQSSLTLALLGALLILIGLFLGVGFGVYRAITKGLPNNDFGLCRGKSQPGYSNPGLTDWLADLIDDIVGRDPKKDPPLTFGDLSMAAASASLPGGKQINLRMMTTNLTLRRPYSLPVNDAVYAFKLDDFKELFPERITTYLVEHCERVDEPGDHKDLFKFPMAKDLPLVVATRMSLSFPLLFCAVPLYARDFTLNNEQEQATWRKNLFSDGGLSSNFPIHFFDRLLPNSPTFAITLDAYDANRQRNQSGISTDDPRSRVWLPKTGSAASGLLISGQPLDGIAAFLSRLIDSAKDWQDNLQSTLAGYRDRIVHVELKSEEGGLNIAMPPELVLSLGAFGAQAGVEMRERFDLDEHRWRRFLVAMTRLNETLDEFTTAYDGQDEIESFASFLARYPDNPSDRPVSYKRAARDHLELLRDRAAALAKLGFDWRSQRQIPDSKLPHPGTDMRITPRT
jgi:predicted acylesterase/phospholipase RssA